MKKIDKYEINKIKLKQIKISNLTDYDIPKMLYADLWHMEELSNTQKIVRVLAHIMCKTLHIRKFEDDCDSTNIAVEIQYPGNIFRKDNQTIFSNLYHYLKPARHILVTKQYIFDPKGIGGRLVGLYRCFRQVQGLPFCSRLFLAAQLVMVRAFIGSMKKVFVSRYCFLLIFQEHDTISNAIIQTAQQYGTKVISPQHGMPMNRHEDNDQLHFDCFLADYKLCWNEATKLQFLSAGIDEKRLVVVGNTKKMYMPLTAKKEKKSFDVFGVVLDGPYIDQGIENNKSLIMIAVKLATEFRLNCVVKLHPFDKKENYLSEIHSSFAKVSILDASITMEEYEDLVDFSLGHTTGAMLDLIYDNCFVFQYKTEVEFPIETDDIYIFHDYEELQKNYLKWKGYYEFYKTKYEDIVKKYRVENPIELHNRFFQTLFQNECNE